MIFTNKFFEEMVVILIMPLEDENEKNMKTTLAITNIDTICSWTAYQGTSVSGCTGTEAEKQIGLWERRIKGLRRMMLGWDQTKPPDPPYLIGVDVSGVTSVVLRVQESCDGPIATKFKGKPKLYEYLCEVKLKLALAEK